MNIKQVRYVCSIIDLGSFSAAAAREGVSVQAVSKAMPEPEASLGEPLFERRSGGVTPTSLGRAFAVRARRVLDEWEALERFASSLFGASPDAPFRVGFCCPTYTGVERLVRLISMVTGKVLGRGVEVELIGCADALGALRSGRSDALLSVGPIEGAGVACGALGTVSSRVLLAADHPLADRDEVTLDELGDYPVLYPSDFEHYCRSVVDAYRERGLRSEPLEVNTYEMSVEFFTRLRGISFMVAGNVTGAGEGLVIRRLRPEDALSVPICLTTLRGPGEIDLVAFRRALSRASLFA